MDVACSVVCRLFSTLAIGAGVVFLWQTLRLSATIWLACAKMKMLSLQEPKHRSSFIRPFSSWEGGVWGRGYTHVGCALLNNVSDSPVCPYVHVHVDDDNLCTMAMHIHTTFPLHAPHCNYHGSGKQANQKFHSSVKTKTRQMLDTNLNFSVSHAIFL